MMAFNALCIFLYAYVNFWFEECTFRCLTINQILDFSKISTQINQRRIFHTNISVLNFFFSIRKYQLSLNNLHSIHRNELNASIHLAVKHLTLNIWLSHSQHDALSSKRFNIKTIEILNNICIENTL